MKALGVKGITLLNEPNDPIQELNLKGEISVIEFDNDNFLKVMYGFIDTNIIEAIDLPSFNLTMWIDEEGKLKNNVYPNLDGTLLYINEYSVQDAVMGHVVFTSLETDDEGYALGLDDEHIEKLQQVIQAIQKGRPDKTFAIDQLPEEPEV